jgi:PiT family inorganic phosphate transporter
MENILIISFILSFYVAWSIGANDETMAPIAGSDLSSILVITLIGGIASLLGAIFFGHQVEHTIGTDLLVSNVSPDEILIIVFSIASWITFSSWQGWPISTTHSAVGAAVGLGLIKNGLAGVRWGTISRIIGAWIISPILGLILNYVATKIIMNFVRAKIKGYVKYMRLSRISSYLLLVLGGFMSFLRGANDIGNATAFLSTQTGYNQIFIRGVIGSGLLIGLVILGKRVLKTVGMEIVKLTPLKGFTTQFCAAIILFLATWLGLPLSSSHVLIGTVVGVGFAEEKWVNIKKIYNLIGIWIGTFFGAGIICGLTYIVGSSI